MLHLFSERGWHSLSQLNYPFALFCWDNSTKELIIATDRLGCFPIFYFFKNGISVFTTDLHAIFNAGVCSPSLQEESIVDFLTIGFPLGEKSMFEGVQRIAAGQLWLGQSKGGCLAFGASANLAA